VLRSVAQSDHECPAETVAYLTVQDAVDQLFDTLPDDEPAVPADLPARRPVLPTGL